MEMVLGVLFSPWFWIIAFFSQLIFQFLLAQKLNHKQAWFAFVPLLSTVQWFQMGKTSAWNIAWIFLPLLGFFIYLYKWFLATITLCERAGERGSFSVLLLFPYINTVALIRLAFKTGFWVKTDLEKDLIKKTIKGLEAGHSPSRLREFALSHGVKLADFEKALDQAQIITRHNLEISSTKFASPVALNIGVAVFYVFSALFFTFYVLSVGIMSFVGAVFSGDFNSVVTSSYTESKQMESAISAEQLSPYDFFMSVQTFSESESSPEYTNLEGTIKKGSMESAQKVYGLDDDFNVVDIFDKKGHAFRRKQGSISVALHEVDPSTIAFVAITPDLAQKNNDWQGQVPSNEGNKAVLVLQEQQRVPQSSNLRDVVVQVKMNALQKTDGLYIYNQALELIGAAKIKHIYQTNDSNQEKIDRLAPGQLASLRLELARPNIAGALYLTPYEDLETWAEYLELLKY